MFAITEPTDQIVGGHVWRSDQYGRVGTWVDVTLQMEGAAPWAALLAAVLDQATEKLCDRCLLLAALCDRATDPCAACRALSTQEGADSDMAGILDLYFHEEHPEKILFAGPAYSHWITTDFGRTFTKVRPAPCSASMMLHISTRAARSSAADRAAQQSDPCSEGACTPDFDPFGGVLPLLWRKAG